MNGIINTKNITTARKDFYNLVERVNLYSEPALIVGKKATQFFYQRMIGMQYRKPYT